MLPNNGHIRLVFSASFHGMKNVFHMVNFPVMFFLQLTDGIC